MQELYEALKQVYALLKVDGDFSVVRHLYIDRVDFCTFGNSTPFRIRIVNAASKGDNQDCILYIKRADASRDLRPRTPSICSRPIDLGFIHARCDAGGGAYPGDAGDIFIRDWLSRPDLRPVRIAKELVKFNERCFVRLLGDMRAYNFVSVVTPDFEDLQLRIRAMDFDQQSYDPRKNFYLPQYFKENVALTLYCLKHLQQETAYQYQREEQTLMLRRAEIASERISLLLHEMSRDPLAPIENVHQLRAELADHYKRAEYERCESMGALVPGKPRIDPPPSRPSHHPADRPE